MKIAYLIGRYPAISHTFILREVHGLRARGVEVETVSVHSVPEDQLLTDAEREEHARTYFVLPASAGKILAAHAAAFMHAPGRYLATLTLALSMSRPGLRGRLWQLFYFAEAMLVWRRCRETGARHLHAQFTNQVTDIALLVTHFERDAEEPWTWSFTVHGPDEFYEVSRFNLKPKVERADFVVCISDFARSQLMALVGEEHWRKLEIVHCGIDPDVFMPADRGEDGEAFHVVCVGRLVPVKGQAVLIEAITRLRESGLDLRATIVGAGPTADDLEGLARTQGLDGAISFTGAVGQDEVRRLLATSDAFCLPSFAEGVPVVLMEAMAMEVPVVTSRIMGIPELVEDGVSGLLTAPGNVDEVAGALAELARDPQRRKALGAAGRRKVIEDFSISDSAVKLHSLFSEQLERR